ncbi:MAG: hypothetical protein EOP51_04390 [Sphingobacteriales bacterium]|nr:MAG: hypothetical protein EOP51_04390 [Sphingobacteriales bacterium]
MSMQKTIITIALFCTQILFLLNGQHIVGTAANPFFVLATGMLLPIYYFFLYLRAEKLQPQDTVATPNTFISKPVVGFIAGCIAMMLTFWGIRQLFWEFPDPYHSSDVILSVEVLYDRFVAGQYPYRPLEQYSWHPFPPYLPLYWLPVYISRILDIDVRWTGVFVLVLAMGLYGLCSWRSKIPLSHKLLAVLLPVFGTVGYLIWCRFDLAVSFEFIIAGYYLMLAAGLATRNMPLVVLGLIGCLLSRFTMIFWLPVFVVLTWVNLPKKQTLIAAGIVIAAVLFIYIIPFYLKDPTAFGKSIAYYKVSAIAEWEGYGDDHTSWTFIPGVHFAPYFKNMFSGTMEERVSHTQTVQAALMIVSVIISFILYRRWRNKINFYDFLLPMLYIIMLLYFMTAPLVFRYYYLTMLTISGVLCGKILLDAHFKHSKSDSTS